MHLIEITTVWLTQVATYLDRNSSNLYVDFPSAEPRVPCVAAAATVAEPRVPCVAETAISAEPMVPCVAAAATSAEPRVPCVTI